ncbi:hypothetical protein [Amycolatopsis albispora]|uniref:Uncharacterized protein n=1 Tax=Amycolatopsis albispora TaxID=1804986 RepID=A0A344L5B1_9PSEU|nr:hypothetical protein [Amycolatopsis albispora]AXB43235.1 hypothetical protein A4R43_12305 [Amycolatopsis albispora]
MARSHSRQLAGELIARNPNASLRAIANVVGLAPSTVLDVRSRLRSGHDPVAGKGNTGSTARKPHRRPALGGRLDRANALTCLKNDPSMRFSEAGRLVLRRLEACPPCSVEWRRAVEALPDHCVEMVASIARKNAESWQEVADSLRRRCELTSCHHDSG